MQKDFIKIHHVKLYNLLVKIFIKYGSSLKIAKKVSHYLTQADLSGQNSHGAARTPLYLEKINDKKLFPNSKLKIFNDNRNIVQIDGNWGFGQVVADEAIKIEIKKAAKYNISCVTIKNSNHLGRLSDFTNQAAKKGYVCIGFLNLHGTSFIVAPFGGKDRKLPSNPISISTPGPDKNKIFELDMSSCTVAEGKLKISYLINKKTTKGYIQDYEGQLTTDTKKFYHEPKGSILPLGGVSGFKGFGLAFAIDIISGALSQAGCSGKENSQHGNATTFICLKTSAFSKLSDFRENVKILTNHVKNSRKKTGFKEILIPGDKENIERKKNIKNGAKIDAATYSKLLNVLKN